MPTPTTAKMSRPVSKHRLVSRSLRFMGLLLLGKVNTRLLSRLHGRRQNVPWKRGPPTEAAGALKEKTAGVNRRAFGSRDHALMRHLLEGRFRSDLAGRYHSEAKRAGNRCRWHQDGDLVVPDTTASCSWCSFAVCAL